MKFFLNGLKLLFKFFIISFLFFCSEFSFSQVGVSPADLNLCAGGGYQTLGDIVITESKKKDFSTGLLLTYAISVPNSTYLEFNPASSVSLTMQDNSGNATLSIISSNVTNSTVTFTYNFDDPKGGAIQSFIISGIQIRAIASPFSGDLIRSFTFNYQNQKNNNPGDDQSHGTITTGNTFATFNVTGGGVYCNSGTGAVVKLDGSESGVPYNLYRGSVSVPNLVTTIIGNGGIVNFGPQTSGTYIATAGSGSCIQNMTGSALVTEKPAFTIFTLSPDNYTLCGSTGVIIHLSGSDLGINYELYKNGVLQQTLPGTGSKLDFNPQFAGNFLVMAVENSGGIPCSKQMNGNFDITTSAAAQNKVIIGGSYCNGADGVQIKLATPQASFGYDLIRISDNSIVSTQISSVIPPDTLFFNKQLSGNYKVSAYPLSNLSCVTPLAGTVSITENAATPAPVINAITPSICSGASTTLTAVGSGFVKYIWFKNGIIIPGEISNTLITSQTGFYQVKGQSGSGCLSDISASQIVTNSTAPPAPILTLSAAIACEGDPVKITASSTSGVVYEFYIDGTNPINLFQQSNSPDFISTTLSAGGRIIYVRIKDAAGCFSSFSNKSVFINSSPGPVIFNSSNPTGTACQFQKITFTASSAGASIYKYFINGILTFSGGGSFSYDSLKIGANQIKVITSNVSGCSIESSIININVLQSPDKFLIAYSTNSLICQGSTTTIKIEKSQIGFNYTLFDSTNTQHGSSVGGTGGSIYLPTDKLYKTTPFAILASNPFTLCEDTLSARPVVQVNVTAIVGASATQSVICEGDTISLLGKIGGAASFATWSSTDIKGRFIFIANSYDAFYIPGQGDINSGKAILTLTSNDPDGAGECLAIAVDVNVVINKRPIVFFSMTGADQYCINNDPVDLKPFASPVGGVFTGDGVSGNFFNPSVATRGDHLITYIVKDPVSNCKSSATVIIKVNSLPKIDFTGLLPFYCKDTSNQVVKLIPIVDDPNGTGVFSGPLGLTSDGKFTPSVLNPGIYTVLYTFTNSNGCTDTTSKKVKISPVPVAAMSIENFCIGKKVNFKDLSTIDSTYGDKIINWNWDFGDGTTSNKQSPSKVYDVKGIYSITLTVTSQDGCSNSTFGSLTIGEIANPDFVWSGGCENGNTYFEGEANGNVASWTWDFGDPLSGLLNTASGKNVIHKFNSIGIYTVKLRISSTEGCVNDVIKKVYVLPLIKVDSLTEYRQDFENGDGNWVPDNLTQDGRYSWKFKNPNGQIINSAFSGSSAWITDYNADTSYLDNENSYVYSPCFDISSMKRPMFTIHIFNSTEPFRDGSVVQISTDEGKTWNRLGDINSGLNWYNASPILSNPGQQPAGVGAVGWSEADSSWRKAVYNLDNYVFNPTVRFRIAFSSNGDNVATQKFNGFAFDDVSITERSHIVLLEHFTNSLSPECLDEDVKINNMVLNRNEEAIAVQYHTSFPIYNDPLYLDNASDLSARALYYNIPAAPRTIVDGKYIDSKLSASTNGQRLFEIQKLAIAQFKINVSLSTDIDKKFTVKAKIISGSTFTDSISVQILIIQKQVIIGNNVFRNVVKKIIPDASGTIMSQSWSAGTTAEISQSVLLTNNLNIDPAQLAVVVVVQNYITKEVYQASYTEPTFVPDIINGIEEEKFSEILIYPNPANEELKIYTGGVNYGKYKYTITNLLGQKIDEGEINTFEKNESFIKTTNYPSGNYILNIEKKKGLNKNFKIIIIH